MIQQGIRGGKRAFATAVVLIVSVFPAHAVTPEEMLDNPALEARARELSQGLRCVVCQNQSIDDSNAPLAHDLRVLLRERLVAGDSDNQAIDYIVTRYGNFVLLKPPMQLNTFLLWMGPGLVALLTLFGVLRYLRADKRSPVAAAEPLTHEEEARFAALLDGKETR
jgi:cytochrome c-type biogenesis protein CcmH